ncbi:GLUG motif-containing protein [Eubacteriaceae bacterium ES3]|nr:GLUG motif-containing protein [Eubacteriaceae bacterium ES3]
MKRQFFYSFIISIFLMASCFLFLGTTVMAAESETPYEISTPAEFNIFANAINNNGGLIGETTYSDAVMTADINFEDPDGDSGTDDAIVITPISSFSGIFDGAGYTMTLPIDSSNSPFVNLDNDEDGAEIKNLTVDCDNFIASSNTGGMVDSVNGGMVTGCSFIGDIVINSNKQYIGGVIGSSAGATISNCSFSGNIGVSFMGIQMVGGIVGSSTNDAITSCTNEGTITINSAECKNIGGIVGYAINNAGSSTISGCTFSGSLKPVNESLSNSNYYGGIVGWVVNKNVENCSFSGEISGYQYVGGIVGYDKLSDISGCHVFDDGSSSSISGSASYVGGIAGYIVNDYSGDYEEVVYISNCTVSGNEAIRATAASNSNSIVGGIVGKTIFCVVEISNCEVSRNVSGEDMYVGGVVGWSANSVRIANTYSTGGVTGATHVGGIVGYLTGNSSIENSYATGNVSGTENNVGGIVGYSGSNNSLTNCYSSGTVSGSGESSQYIGGIIGDSSSNVLSNCYATGAVSGTGASSKNIGGIIGRSVSDTINHVFASGAVSGDTYLGGLIGRKSSGSFTNGYYLDNGNFNGFGGAGLINDSTEVHAVSDFSTAIAGWGLQNGQASQDTLVWGQTVGTDATPQLLFYNANAKKVYQVSFNKADTTILNDYCNIGGAYTIPEPTAGYTWVNDATSTAVTPGTYTMATAELSFTESEAPTMTPDKTVINDQESLALAFTALSSTGAPYTYRYKIDGGDWTVITETTDNPYSLSGLSLATGSHTFILQQKLDATTWSLEAVADVYCLEAGPSGIQINSLDDLINFSAYINEGGHAIIDASLNADLNLAGSQNNQWVPIGKSASSYRGSFDGNGYTVSGIFINNSSEDQGFFGYCDGATIQNLNLSAILTGGTNVGGITGTAANGCLISKCSLSATIVANDGDAVAGGIAGIVSGTASEIANCSLTGSVSGNISGTPLGVGGITGLVTDIAVTINNCSVSASITTSGQSTNLGGIIGQYADAPILSNLFYISDDTINTGISGLGGSVSQSGEITGATTTEYQSGLVAWELQGGQSDPNTLVWGQTLSGGSKEDYPVLTSYSSKKVEKVLFKDTDGSSLLYTRYANYNATVGDYPNPGDDYYWKNSSDHSAFDENTLVTTDLVLQNTQLQDMTGISGDDPISIYTGGSPDYNISGLPSGASTEYSTDGTNFTTTAPTFNETGTYTVTLRFSADGYRDYTKSTTVTVSNAPTGGGGSSSQPMNDIQIDPLTTTTNKEVDIVIDIEGLPNGSTVYYSTDGENFSTTPPSFTETGTYDVIVRVTAPGYQDYETITTVTIISPNLDPVVAEPYDNGASDVEGDLGTPVAAPGGGFATHYQANAGQLVPQGAGAILAYALGEVDDPSVILVGTGSSGAPAEPGNGVPGAPSVSVDGILSCFLNLIPGYAGSGPAIPVVGNVLSAMAEESNEEEIMLSAWVTILVTTENYGELEIPVIVQVPERHYDVAYRTHNQNIGWEENFVEDGTLSGTTGQSLRLEAIEIEMDSNYDLGVSYRAHVQNLGWEENYVADGEEAGTVGQALRLEAIEISLTGADADYFDIYYQVHVQNLGWLGWASNGASAGSAGFGYRLEGIRIVVVPKGADAPGETANCFIEQ